MKRLYFIRGAGYLALLDSGRVASTCGDGYFHIVNGLAVVTEVG